MIQPYYQEDGITVFCADCREVLPQIQADVVVTDPPYGPGQKIAYDVYKDTLEEWKSLMEWLLALPYPTAFTMSHSRFFDLPRRPQWVGCWDKVFTGGITHIGASPSWEPICFYNLPRGDTGKPRWRDVFRCLPYGFPFNVARARDLNGHPCPKPVGLYQKILRVMPPGVVLDPMMGSGTTLRAAKDLGRHAIGIDISEQYCAMAVERLRQRALPLEPAG